MSRLARFLNLVRPIVCGLMFALPVADSDAQEAQLPGMRMSVSEEFAELFMLPKEHTTPCQMERTPLGVREVALASGYGLSKAERLDDGWVAYDDYSRRIIEMSDRLEEVAVWGRPGPGPLEYHGAPQGAGKTNTGIPFAVDNTTPPTMLLFGSIPKEYALVSASGHLALPQDAVMASDTLFLATREGIYQSALGERDIALRWEADRDFGIVVRSEGADPRFRLRLGADGGLYVATLMQSAIWSLTEDATPQLLLQRCVPDVWKTVHASAPTMQVPGFSVAGVTVKGSGGVLTRNTLTDFTVLATGQVLVLGGLHFDDGEGPWGRSLELYDENGALVKAWTVPITGSAVFDPGNPRRLLTWGHWGGPDAARLEGVVRLVEVDGEGYPATS